MAMVGYGGKCTLACIVVLLCVDLIYAGGSITSDLWINIPTPSNSPYPRYSHSSVFNPVNKTMVVFGGMNSTNLPGNDVAAYTVDTGDWNPWVEYSGNAPSPRYGHSAVATGLNYMVVFGGQVNDSYFLNDVAIYDMVEDKWLETSIQGNAPGPRAYHTAVVDRYRHVMYVYGGMDENGDALSDMFMFNLETRIWTEVKVDNAVSRMYHSAIMTQQGLMVVFGGFGLSDVSCFDARNVDNLAINQTWYNCLTETTPAPAVRYGHSAVFSPLQQMVVYGGRNSAGNPVNDVWTFDLTTFKWEVVLPGGAPVNPRAFHTGVATTFGSMIIFGGIDVDGVTTNDFGLYNLANTVLRSADDGAVLVVLVTLLGTILLIMCFALDYMQEQNEIEKDEAVIKAREEKRMAEQLLIPRLPAIPKALQIPLGPKAQRFLDEFKMSMDPMREPPK